MLFHQFAAVAFQRLPEIGAPLRENARVRDERIVPVIFSALGYSMAMANAGPFHDTNAEKLTLPALEALQAEKLNALLAAVAGSNKFYKNKFKAAGVKISESAKLSVRDLPISTKSEFAKDQEKSPPFGSNLTFPLNDYCRFHHTSGSTGNSIRWLDTIESWEWMLRSWSYVLSAAGVKPKDRICFAFSFGPFLGFWTAFEAATRFGALCMPAGGLSTSARLRFMLDNGISVVCCTPTYALRMAETAAAENINIALSPVRLLIVAGEPGGSIPQTRARIEEAWGARCVDHYGMTEVGPTAFACEKVRGRLHIIESEFIAECLKPGSTDPVALGESGELVLTNLGRTASPAIRYRTGDLVRMTRHTPCACGRSFVALEDGILGRVDDMLLVRGVNVYPSAVEEVLRRFPAIAEYRVEISRVRSMTELKLTIEPVAGERETKSLPAKLTAELEKSLGLRVPVELAGAGSLPRFEMKSQRWVRVKEV
jgi:phenylacetate-CoA ligase